MRVGRVRGSGLTAVVCAVLTIQAAAPRRLRGQEAPTGASTLALFFDCQGSGCYDLDFFRREIPYVNWVRDRESADVHVLVTSQTTGGGGLETTLAFIGRGRFEGEDQSLILHTSGDATQDEIRKAQAARLQLGLGRYLAATGMADQLKVVAPGGPGGHGGPNGAGAPPPGGAPEDDPWDFWVFRIGANGYLNGESSYKQRNISTSVSANRTTEDWKVSLSGRYYTRHEHYELSDGPLDSEWKDWNANGLLVRSLSDHWSVGAKVGAGRSTTLNEDLRWNVAPGVEVNLFPYSESSRRSLTLQALLDMRHWDYTEETIFHATSETRLAMSLTSSLNLVQPWGRAEITLDHSRYLYDTRKYQASLSGFFEVRVFKGFSVNMYGGYSRIHDQLYLPAEGASDEEILVQQRQLETSYRYYTSFGVSYRFGSIFNNVVNTRFGGGRSFF